MGTTNTKDKELARVLKALANERRLAILRFLNSKKEAPVGRVAEEIKLSFKATSKHLALLAAAGILEKEHRLNQMFFYIPKSLPEIARRILSFL